MVMPGWRPMHAYMQVISGALVFGPAWDRDDAYTDQRNDLHTNQVPVPHLPVPHVLHLCVACCSPVLAVALAVHVCCTMGMLQAGSGVVGPTRPVCGVPAQQVPVGCSPVLCCLREQRKRAQCCGHPCGVLCCRRLASSTTLDSQVHWLA